MANDELNVFCLESDYATTKMWNDIPKTNFDGYPTTIPVKRKIPEIAQIQDSKKLDKNDTQDNYRNFQISQYANAFIENVGLQGLRYVFMRNTTWTRRLIWLCLLLAGSAYCVYVTISNVNNFYDYPTITTTTTHYVTQLDFPAVTICDYNIFQRSRITQEEYDMLLDMYMPYEFMYNETGKDPERYNHVDMAELMINASFSYDLDFCFYHSLSCNKSHTYQQLRDVGNCITFDPSQHGFYSYQHLAGREGGLNMGLAKYGQQWTPGPFMNSQGFIAMVHEPGEDVVMVENFGINVPMGYIVNLVVSRTDVTLLPPPHGQCGTRSLQYFDKYTQVACQQECGLQQYISYCGCKLAYMRGENTTKTCNNIQLRACSANFFANLSSKC
uniref:acid-sensing ion channel 5-like n=1 Tax=Styela clava TaxID=7725 RepID=UPI001939D2C1|nr:acid-sensing ion channel 5-like [Styela clava]